MWKEDVKELMRIYLKKIHLPWQTANTQKSGLQWMFPVLFSKLHLIFICSHVEINSVTYFSCVSWWDKYLVCILPVLSQQEKLLLANREKDKGNEAFRANDYEEAVAYYSRSSALDISFIVDGNYYFNKEIVLPFLSFIMAAVVHRGLISFPSLVLTNKYILLICPSITEAFPL